MDLGKIDGAFTASFDGKYGKAPYGMVSAAFPEAAEAGAEMLDRGGNAVDAACAAALALGVCEPQASGLGGQTMGMLAMNGKICYLDGSGRIPAGAHASRMTPDDLRHGYKATTIPSTIAVLGWVHRKYGRLPWAALFEPAMGIARAGYAITALQHRLQERELGNFNRVPSGSGATFFLKNGNRPYEVGEVFKQPDLANLLNHLAHNGPESFYTGKIAAEIHADMKANQGFLNAKDLENIPWPSEKPALPCAFNGLTLHVPPPPSPGRGLMAMLELFKAIKAIHPDTGSPADPAVLARIIRHVLTALARFPVHPALYAADTDPLLADDFIQHAARAILDGVPHDDNPPVAMPLGGETTHLSVIDNDGNAVGLTQSVNSVYGAKAAAQGLGFLYNNYLLDSNISDPHHPHYLSPGNLPVSMICPTIVCKGNDLWMVTGSPGSDRIISAVFQFLIHVLEENRSIRDAMEQPRLHLTPAGKLSIEADRFPEKILDRLSRSGYCMDRRNPWSFFLGAIHTVVKCVDGSGFLGAAEIRRDGSVRGGHERGPM